jgi:hypothetical protein
LRSKESAAREGAGDGKKDESLFHWRSHFDSLPTSRAGFLTALPGSSTKHHHLQILPDR